MNFSTTSSSSALLAASAWENLFNDIRTAKDATDSTVLVSQALEITHYWYSTSCGTAVSSSSTPILSLPTLTRYCQLVEDYLFRNTVPTLYTMTTTTTTITKKTTKQQPTIKIIRKLSPDTVLWTFVWSILLKLRHTTIPSPVLLVPSIFLPQQYDTTVNRLNFFIQLVCDYYPPYYTSTVMKSTITLDDYKYLRNLALLLGSIRCTLDDTHRLFSCHTTPIKDTNTQHNSNASSTVRLPVEDDNDDQIDEGKDNTVPPYLNELLSITKIVHQKMYENRNQGDDETIKDEYINQNGDDDTTDDGRNDRILYRIPTCNCSWDIFNGYHSRIYTTKMNNLWLYTNYADMEKGIEILYHTNTNYLSLTQKLELLLPITIGMIDIPHTVHSTTHDTEINPNEGKPMKQTSLLSTFVRTNTNSFSSSSATAGSADLSFLSYASSLHGSLRRLYVLIQSLMHQYPYLMWNDIPRFIVTYMVTVLGTSIPLSSLAVRNKAWITFIESSSVSPWSVIGLCIGTTLHKYSQSVLGLEIQTVLTMIKTIELCLCIPYTPHRYVHPTVPSVNMGYYPYSATQKLYLFDNGDLVWSNNPDIFQDDDTNESTNDGDNREPVIRILPYTIMDNLGKYLRDFSIPKDSSITIAVNNLANISSLTTYPYGNYVLRYYQLVKDFDIPLSYLWISKYTDVVPFPSLPSPFVSSSSRAVWTNPSSVVPVLQRFHTLVQTLFHDTSITLNYSTTILQSSDAAPVWQLFALLNGATGLILQDLFTILRLLFTKGQSVWNTGITNDTVKNDGKVLSTTPVSSKSSKRVSVSHDENPSIRIHEEMITLLMNTLGYGIGILSSCLNYACRRGTEDRSLSLPVNIHRILLDRILTKDTIILYIAEILDICLEKVPLPLTSFLVQQIHYLDHYLHEYANVFATKNDTPMTRTTEEEEGFNGNSEHDHAVTISLHKWVFLKGILYGCSKQQTSLSSLASTDIRSDTNPFSLSSFSSFPPHPLLSYIYYMDPHQGDTFNTTHYPYRIPRFYSSDISNRTDVNVSDTVSSPIMTTVSPKSKTGTTKTKGTLSSSMTNISTAVVLRSRNRVIDSWLQETLIDEDDEEKGRRKKRTRVRDRYLDLEDFIVE